MDIETGEGFPQELDDIKFEQRYTNVFNKANDHVRNSLYFHYGQPRIHDNGLKQRERQEINAGLKVIDRLGVQITKGHIYNLPFTVLDMYNRPANTAFTDPKLEHRHVYLVPDHTPTRVLNDQAHHKNGIESVIQVYNGDETVIHRCARWLEALEGLNPAERVAASILHEYGHILTYFSMDAAGVWEVDELYVWLDDSGYLDNCSSRIVNFNGTSASDEYNARWQINVAIEQMAEDYRLSHYVNSDDDVCPLPSHASYKQDIACPGLLMEGVEIVTKLISIPVKDKATNKVSNAIESVLPFGEAPRSEAIMGAFNNGPIVPLTLEDKQRAKKALRKLAGK